MTGIVIPFPHRPKSRSIDRHVGSRVRLARERAGLSQEALAQRIGVSPGRIARGESGEERLGAVMPIALVKALGVRIRFFFAAMVVD